MAEVLVGVVLTAALGGFLVPLLKANYDRRADRYASSVALVDTLASSLWGYWKLALRVAYYGRKGEQAAEELHRALGAWDSDQSWDIGRDIQIQVSRSKRLLPVRARNTLDEAQQRVVDHLDQRIETLRTGGTPDKWGDLYEWLMKEGRSEIDSLLGEVAEELDLGQRRKGLLPPWRTAS